jgi:hypothetical protein
VIYEGAMLYDVVTPVPIPADVSYSPLEVATKS